MNEKFRPNMPKEFLKGYHYTDTKGLSEVYYQEIEGLAIFQEDMILGTAKSMNGFNSLALAEELFVIGAARINGLEWPNKTIPYEISTDAVSVKQIKEAIAYYNNFTEICMRPKTGSDGNWVKFIKGDGCASYVGCIGGCQQIWIADWANTGNVIHEIGHCLGLYHEHSRQDRDNFVTIRPDLLSNHNYDKYNPGSGKDLSEYDYGSIMHYPRSGDCIVPKDPNAQIGQRDGLSTLDKLAIQSIYLQKDTSPITDLDIISGDNPNIAPKDGFVKISQDLNQGAGGKYIYICYKKEPNTTPITDIAVIHGGSTDINPPAGYVKLPQDVNQGAGGEYIYVCYTKKQNAIPVSNITIVAGDSDDISNTTGYGYSAIGVDLNKGSGGKYIYLFVQKNSNLPITDVIVINGVNTDVAPPNDYQKVNFNLNDSVGGDYIYACYMRKQSTNGVTDLTVIVGDNSNIEPPSDYTKIPVDLNKGAGGKYIYLCKKMGNASLITDIIAIGSKWSGIQPPVGYSRIDVDLNQGSGGEYIYLCYKK